MVYPAVLFGLVQVFLCITANFSDAKNPIKDGVHHKYLRNANTSHNEIEINEHQYDSLTSNDGITDHDESTKVFKGGKFCYL